MNELLLMMMLSEMLKEEKTYTFYDVQGCNIHLFSCEEVGANDLHKALQHAQKSFPQLQQIQNLQPVFVKRIENVPEQEVRRFLDTKPKGLWIELKAQEN